MKLITARQLFNNKDQYLEEDICYNVLGNLRKGTLVSCSEIAGQGPIILCCDFKNENVHYFKLDDKVVVPS
jgi:hypothetical protein